jgi:hypothetical protein
MADPSLPGAVVVRNGDTAPRKVIQVFELKNRSIEDVLPLLQKEEGWDASQSCQFFYCTCLIGGTFCTCNLGELRKLVLVFFYLAVFLWKNDICRIASKHTIATNELIPWSKQEEKACTLKKGTVLASGPLMLKDGQVCDLSGTNRNFVNTKHPRSAVALTREGKILLIVVDGRRKGKAEGINIPELAHMIRILGGEDALNLDGGGSSTLWSGALPDKGIANTPSGSAERKVANSLCVYE